MSRSASRFWSLPLWLCLAGGCVVEYRATPANDSGSSTSAPSTTAEPPSECEDDEQTLCDDACVSLEWDSAHCGACKSPCLLNTECVAGECLGACGPECDDPFHICDEGVCRCRPGLLSCNGLCVDSESDPEHCGECWNDCPAPSNLCGFGDCMEECGEFQDECEGTCTIVADDPLNCGTCGRVCAADELCADGECVLYEFIDPVQCDECPCSRSCEDLCCFSERLDSLVCVEGPECPEE